MSSTRHPSRRVARERAFQTLFALDFHQGNLPRGLMATFEAFFAEELARKPRQKAYAEEIIQGVCAHARELDEIIASHSRHWKLERIARIERTMLRLAVYEILHRLDIPHKVSINEAVELAKMYGDENSPGFINGILDAVARTMTHDPSGTVSGP